MARPLGSDFTQEIADIICGEIAEGKSLRSILRGNPDMPAMSTVFKWLREEKGFSEQYARAKEEQADAFAEEMQDIADDGTNDWMEFTDKNGNVAYKLNGEHVQRSRLRIDTRKWIASKLRPKKYGDKVDVEHSGSVGVTFTTIYESKPDEEK